MPVSLNEFVTISLAIFAQDSLTQVAMVTSSTRLRLPALVRVGLSFAIQSCHCSLMFTLKGLLRNTSRGWRIPVRLPGMTAWVVLCSASLFFTRSVRWPLNESYTRRAFFPSSVPGLVAHTSLNQTSISSSSIHPFVFTWMTTHLGISLLGLSFSWRLTCVWAWCHEPCRSGPKSNHSFHSCGPILHGFGTLALNSSTWHHVRLHWSFIHVCYARQVEAIFCSFPMDKWLEIIHFFGAADLVVFVIFWSLGKWRDCSFA